MTNKMHQPDFKYAVIFRAIKMYSKLDTSHNATNTHFGIN